MFQLPLRLSERQSRVRQSRGVATVEVAICLPIFVVVVFGTIECCDLMFLRQGLLQAAYEGARVAIVPNAKSENVLEQVDRILVQRGIQASAVRIIPPDFHEAPFGTEVTVEIDASPAQTDN
jgi:Flp pilus assembly protein TadG